MRCPGRVAGTEPNGNPYSEGDLSLNLSHEALKNAFLEFRLSSTWLTGRRIERDTARPQRLLPALPMPICVRATPPSKGTKGGQCSTDRCSSHFSYRVRACARARVPPRNQCLHRSRGGLSAETGSSSSEVFTVRTRTGRRSTSPLRRRGGCPTWREKRLRRGQRGYCGSTSQRRVSGREQVLLVFSLEGVWR